MNELEQPVKDRINALAARNARFVVLLSGHDPFMGQTSDLDACFVHLIMQRHKLKSCAKIKLVFSPASYYPLDQQAYARHFRSYYDEHFSIRPVYMDLQPLYELRLLRQVAGVLERCESAGDTLGLAGELALLCFSYSLDAHTRAAAVLGPTAREIERYVMGNLANIPLYRQIRDNILLPMLQTGKQDVASMRRFIRETEKSTRRQANRRFDSHKRLLGSAHGFYGGGGRPGSLLYAYDYPLSGGSYWNLIHRAFERGMVLLGYSAHALLFSAYSSRRVRYTGETRCSAFRDRLAARHVRVIPRKRDYLLIQPMKGLVPFGLIVHFERFAGQQRQWELRYLEETLAQDVFALRNNCAMICVPKQNQQVDILGLISRNAPNGGDRVNEIRYFDFDTGEPRTIGHNVLKSFGPNEPLPGT